MTPAFISRLMTFAQTGYPKAYAASDVMRGDVFALMEAAGRAYPEPRSKKSLAQLIEEENARWLAEQEPV